MDKTVKAIKKLVQENLGIKKEERVLIFCDIISEHETPNDDDRTRRAQLAETAHSIFKYISKTNETVFLKYEATGTHGVEPPDYIWKEAFGSHVYGSLRDSGVLEALLKKKAGKKQILEAEQIVMERSDDAVDVVIALSNFSTSHTKFRDLVTTCAGARYASMPLFDPDMFLGPMDVDWNEVKENTVRIAEKLTDAVSATITAPNGTNLSIGLNGRQGIADTGILTEEGAFGNLPAGEAFIAPPEYTAEGLFVAEWGPTRKFKFPVKFEIKKGTIFILQGLDKFASSMRQQIDIEPKCAVLAELGIGTNPKASKPDNILESEKILGTIHIAFGDNMSFGGKIRTSFHQDFVLFSPTVELKYAEGNREIIIKEGKLVG